MKQYILQKSVVPPGGWKAKCPHCSLWINAPTYPDFVEWIERHNKTNNHEEWDYITQLCESLPPGHCMMENGAPGIGNQCTMTATGLLAGAAAVGSMLVEFALGRDVFVDQAEAERRATICTRCPKNIGVDGCGGCATMQNAKEMLSNIKGSRTTSVDQALFGCCVCGCDLKTIVHIRKDILERGFTQEQRTLTEATAPHCWKL